MIPNNFTNSAGLHLFNLDYDWAVQTYLPTENLQTQYLVKQIGPGINRFWGPKFRLAWKSNMKLTSKKNAIYGSDHVINKQYDKMSNNIVKQKINLKVQVEFEANCYFNNSRIF